MWTSQQTGWVRRAGALRSQGWTWQPGSPQEPIQKPNPCILPTSEPLGISNEMLGKASSGLIQALMESPSSSTPRTRRALGSQELPCHSLPLCRVIYSGRFHTQTPWCALCPWAECGHTEIAIQVDLGDIEGSVPDHGNKAYIEIKHGP